jgi:hypothetical protein
MVGQRRHRPPEPRPARAKVRSGFVREPRQLLVVLECAIVTPGCAALRHLVSGHRPRDGSRRHWRCSGCERTDSRRAPELERYSRSRTRATQPLARVPSASSTSPASQLSRGALPDWESTRSTASHQNCTLSSAAPVKNVAGKPHDDTGTGDHVRISVVEGQADGTPDSVPSASGSSGRAAPDAVAEMPHLRCEFPGRHGECRPRAHDSRR